MKNFIFSAFCGIMLFVLLLATSCTNNVKNNIQEDEGISYTIDPLDSMLTKIELKDSDLITIKGEENVVETDTGFIRYCPVKFIDSETCAVKDTVFIINEKY